MSGSGRVDCFINADKLGPAIKACNSDYIDIRQRPDNQWLELKYPGTDHSLPTEAWACKDYVPSVSPFIALEVDGTQLEKGLNRLSGCIGQSGLTTYKTSCYGFCVKDGKLKIFCTNGKAFGIQNIAINRMSVPDFKDKMLGAINETSALVMWRMGHDRERLTLEFANPDQDNEAKSFRIGNIYPGDTTVQPGITISCVGRIMVVNMNFVRKVAETKFTDQGFSVMSRDWAEALGRVCVTGNKEELFLAPDTVRLTLKGSEVIMTTTSTKGASKTSIPVKKSKGEFNLLATAKILINAARGFDETKTIDFEYGGPEKMHRIQHGEFMYYFLPLAERDETSQKNGR